MSFFGFIIILIAFFHLTSQAFPARHGPWVLRKTLVDYGRGLELIRDEALYLTCGHKCSPWALLSSTSLFKMYSIVECIYENFPSMSLKETCTE